MVTRHWGSFHLAVLLLSNCGSHCSPTWKRELQISRRYLPNSKEEREGPTTCLPSGHYQEVTAETFIYVFLARAQSPDISLLGNLENVALFWTATCPAINQSFCFEKRTGEWLPGDKNSLCHRYLLCAVYESLMAQFISASAYVRKIKVHFSFVYIFIFLQQLLLEGYLYDLWDIRHSSDRKTKQKGFLYNKRNGLIREKSLRSRSK